MSSLDFINPIVIIVVFSLFSIIGLANLLIFLWSWELYFLKNATRCIVLSITWSALVVVGQALKEFL